jgi:hypothetical protein
MDQGDGKVRFHFQNSNQFRVVRADGAWGGVTPELELFFSLYNTRPAIPQLLVHPINPDGTLGPDIPELKVSKEGFVREVEVGVIMQKQHVAALIEFLKDRLAFIESVEARAGAMKK